MNNITEVKLYKDDFHVVLFALMECQNAWRAMIDEGEIPDIPGMDLARAQHILTRFSEVREKIQAIVDGEPLKVGGEALERIMGIIKEEGQ